MPDDDAVMDPVGVPVGDSLTDCKDVGDWVMEPVVDGDEVGDAVADMSTDDESLADRDTEAVGVVAAEAVWLGVPVDVPDLESEM